MVSAILAIIFIILLFLSSGLQRVFYHLSPGELKRRARAGEAAAKQLYRPAAHAENLHLLLWVVIIISATLSCIFMSRSLSFWPSFFLILLVLWLNFVWLPNSRVSQLELDSVSWLAAPLEWLLNVLNAPLDQLVRLSNRFRPANFHTGMYQKRDVLNMLAAQKAQVDNRIDEESLDIAMRGLEFGDKMVEDFMTPRSAVMTVAADDSVSPKLIDELHKSGQKLFPVVEGKPEKIVGCLRLGDLVDLKKSGSVRGLMEPKVFYIHEDFVLARVLDAFYKTHQHLYVVVNKFEDFVGVITIEDVIEQIIGEPLLSDFDDYDSREAVAAHVAHQAVGAEMQTEDLVAEVVE